jgi:hypothetical protein
VELIPGGSLQTATAQQGRELAMKMARLVIKATQPDAGVRDRLRAAYADDAATLLQVAHIVAVEFATIAAANDHWRHTEDQ